MRPAKWIEILDRPVIATRYPLACAMAHNGIDLVNRNICHPLSGIIVSVLLVVLAAYDNTCNIAVGGITACCLLIILATSRSRFFKHKLSLPSRIVAMTFVAVAVALCGTGGYNAVISQYKSKRSDEDKRFTEAMTRVLRKSQLEVSGDQQVNLFLDSDHFAEMLRLVIAAKPRELFIKHGITFSQLQTVIQIEALMAEGHWVVGDIIQYPYHGKGTKIMGPGSADKDVLLVQRLMSLAGLNARYSGHSWNATDLVLELP